LSFDIGTPFLARAAYENGDLGDPID